MMSSTLRRITGLAVAVLIVATASPRAEQTQSAGDTSVNVTVKYTGAGPVDASHRIWVWVFDTPNIGPEAIPIDEQSISANGGRATFSTASKQVYIAVAYDHTGGFMGQAPPPSGSPVAVYGVNAANEQPQPVTPGAKGSVTVTFDDSQRMP